MSESQDEQVARLLRDGLDRYGDGEVTAAIQCWRQVLKLVPDHIEAVDYIRTADRRKRPRLGGGAYDGPATTSLLQDARGLMQSGDHCAALDLLRSAPEADVSGLEFEACIELARATLYRGYSGRFSDLLRMPALKVPVDDITKFNIPTDAGFLISIMDGMTSLEDLIAVSGMDAFEALHMLDGLLEAGIAELSP